MSCSGRTIETNPATYSELVRRYVRDYRERARRELRFYAIQPTYDEALEKAALCKLPSGNRHDHQHRIPGAVLNSAFRALRQADLRHATSFTQLYRLVRDAILPIRGIAELTVYDIAHRIGAKLGLEPDCVYLHAGTRVGARALGIRGDCIARGEVVRKYPWVADLSADELEDFLCIYKTELAQMAASLA